MSTTKVDRTDNATDGVAARLKALLGVLGLTQAEFATRLRISKQSMNRYLKDRRHPNPEFLARIAREAGTTVDYLLRGEGPQEVRLSPLARRVQLDLRDVTDDETAVLFPLVRALLELRRSNGDDSFKLLLDNTRASIKAQQLDLGPIDKAISEFRKQAVRRPVGDKAVRP